MTKFVFTSLAAGALASAALGLSGTAAAFPGAASAADTIKSLQSEGYNVQVNGVITSAPLSRCSVAGVHPTLDDSASRQEKQHTLVTVDVACPSD